MDPGRATQAAFTTVAGVLDHVTHWAQETPDNLAFVDERTGDEPGTTRRLGWQEFEAEVNRWANAILDAGIEPDQFVGWCGSNCMEAVAIAHAARRTGVIAVPIPYRLTTEEAHWIANHSEVSMVWTQPEFDHLVPAAIPRFDKSDNAAATPAERMTEATRTLLYTSGTTGRPKGALRATGGAPGQFGAMLELIWGGGNHRFTDGQPHVYLTTGPLYHSGPSAFGLRAHLLGAAVITQPKFGAERWLATVQREGVTTTFTAPTAMRRVTSLPAEVRAKYDTSSMRALIANAAPWTMALKRAYLDQFPPESLWEVYGSTELSVSAVMAPEDHLRKPGSCGQLAPGVEMALFTEAGERITEPHTEGVLYVRSPAVFDTYFKNDEQFQANRLDDWQTVGDIAYFDEDEFWYICDRRTDLIVSGGVNVYPAEIENVLDDHAALAEVAVFGVPDEEWGQAVHAAIRVTPGADAPTVDELREFGRERLAGYKLPRGISVFDDFPRTGSGKVLRREIRSQVLETLT